MHRFLRAAVAGVAATLFLTGTALTLIVGTATTADAVSASAAAPIPVYTENFEHGVGATPVPLPSYTGANGVTYTADPAWLTACNGVVVQWSALGSDLPLSGCNRKKPADNADAYSQLRRLAYALGVVGRTDPTTNHAVSAFTDGANPGANKLEFATVNPIVIPGASPTHFLAMSIDSAAMYCYYSSPQYLFSVSDATGNVTSLGSALNVCTMPGVNITAPAPDRSTAPSEVIHAGTYTTRSAFLFSGGSLSFTLVNANGSGSGNDAAFDNIRIVDVTPGLTKSFAPALIAPGGTSTLTFTVTNTSELAAKPGFSFTDDLPAGMTVAPTPGFTSTCQGGTVTAGGTAGASTVSLKGALAVGAAACTFTIGVTAAAEGTYVNGPANVHGEIGLLPPDPATLQVHPRTTVTTPTTTSTTTPTPTTSTTSTSTTSTSTTSTSTTSTTTTTAPAPAAVAEATVPSASPAAASTTTATSTTTAPIATPTTTSLPIRVTPTTIPARSGPRSPSHPDSLAATGRASGRAAAVGTSMILLGGLVLLVGRRTGAADHDGEGRRG